MVVRGPSLGTSHKKRSSWMRGGKSERELDKLESHLFGGNHHLDLSECLLGIFNIEIITQIVNNDALLILIYLLEFVNLQF